MLQSAVHSGGDLISGIPDFCQSLPHLLRVTLPQGRRQAAEVVWHEKPISKAHGIIDTDLARDNLENDIPFADLQDL